MTSQKMSCFLISLFAAFAYIHGSLAQDEKEEPESINSGFVFVDGSYIDAPYRVEARDLLIFINGIQITQPPYIGPNLIVTEDPGVPPGITKEVGVNDLFKINWEEGLPYYIAKLAYLWGKYSKEEAQDKMMAYYKSLPCIKEAVRWRDDGVKLTDYKGKSCLVDLFIHDWAFKPPPTEEELQEQVEKLANIYRERFEKGDCYFFFKKGIKLSMTERKAVNILREMCDVLLDNTMDNQAKTNELLGLGLIPAHDVDLAEMVVSNFQQNDQFDERLEALQQKIIEKYGPDAIHSAERVGDLAIKEQQQKEEYFQKKLKNESSR